MVLLRFGICEPITVCNVGYHTAAVKSVAFNSDGSLLASGEREHVRLWDVHKGHQIAAFKHTAIVESIVFNSDGKTLACVDGNCIRLWTRT